MKEKFYELLGLTFTLFMVLLSLVIAGFVFIKLGGF